MAKRQTVQDRATTTTRLYADNVTMLRMLAESKGVAMIEYVDQLVHEAVRKDGSAITRLVEAFAAAVPKKAGK